MVGAKLTRKRMKALRFSNDEIDAVATLVELHLRFHGYGTGEWTDSAVRRYVRDAGDLLTRLHVLTRADCTTRNRRKAEALRTAYDHLEERIERLSEAGGAGRDPARPGRQPDHGRSSASRPGREVGEAYRYLLELRMEHGPLGEERATRRTARLVGRAASVSGPEPTGRRYRGLGSLVIDTSPLRIPAYRRLWVSTAVTGTGSQLSAVAVPKQLYDLTGSSAYVGLTGAVGLAALLLFGLWGGAIADAFDRRTVMIVSNLGIVVTSALLWLQAVAGLDSIVVVLALFGIEQSFVAVNSPARHAAIARMVPASLLVAANALGFTVAMFTAVFGPLVAGALIPVFGLQTLYLVDTVALTVAVVMVVQLPRIPPGERASRTAGLRDIVDGFRYLRLHTVLLASFLVDLIAMVAGMPKALFPEMAVHTFGDPAGGGAGLGWLFAALPLGALVCGLFSGRLSRLRSSGVVVTFSIVIWGLAIVGFGLSGVLWLAVLCLAVGGAADMVSGIHRGAILQAASTDEMRGRIQGVFIVVVAGGPRLADVVHGWAGANFGTATTVVAGGILVVILTVVAVAVMPAFWRYRTPDPGEDRAAPA